ncbi:Nop14-like protein [Rhodotorula sp. JG-1b]|nr:Nop14-like protein [Rhodotorula sp. JG-1b]
MGGSQLTQLRSKLKEQGLNRQSNPKDARKRAKQRKDLSLKHRNSKLEAIHEQFNLFDVRDEKKKFSVVTRSGREEGGAKGMPGKARAAGIESRKKTLLPMLDARTHASTFVDHRFGESATHLTPEEKALERFTAERQSRLGGASANANKRMRFNLEDDDAADGGEISLTHGGRKLGFGDEDSLDDGGWGGLGVSEGANREPLLNRRKMGAEPEEEEDDGRKKSHNEIMQEVMAKSKFHKVCLFLASGVDRDLLRKLIGSAADERSPSPPPAASTSSAPAVPGERPPPADLEPESKDPYDLYVRQLALEPRAHATDRLKTPLELAQEAAEQLRKQEERRLKRARGEQDESDNDDDENQGDGKKKRERKRAPQGDDLDDDYLQEQYSSDAEAAAAGADGEDGLGAGLEDAEELVVLGGDSDVEAESGDEEDGSEEESGEDDDEEEDDMDVGDLDATDSDDEVAAEGEQEALVAPSAAKFDAAGELPYTFPCPSSHAEFAKLLSSSGIKEQDTITVVKRIRTLYHPGLAEGNKEKMQVFANVLLDHIVFLSASSSPTAFETINSILPPLLTLSHAYPLTCAPHYVKKIGLMHKNLLRGLIKGPLEPAAKTWPGVPELTLLRLVGMVWSTSDLSHPVVAPALLLISEYLSQGRVRSLSDVTSGLFLCSLVAQYEELSHRIVPEAFNFLANAAALLLPTATSIVTSFPGYFPTPDLGQEHVKALKVRQAAATLTPSATVDLLGALASSAKGKAKASSPAVEQLKVDLASSTMKLVEVYRSMYAGSEAFIELFTPLERVLRSAKVAKLPPTLATEVTTTREALSRAITFAGQSRQPLYLQHHKPIPLATYLPKFDEGFNPNRRFDPDSERAEASKLRALYRKEKKGAVRELRNDNRFLAVEEAKRKQEENQQYEKKISKIVSSLQDERAEEKAFERTKRRDKARAGRRS